MDIIKNTSYTASTKVLETETGEHDFTITNFYFEEDLCQNKSSKGISSGNFIVGGYNWTICLKPYGNEYLSVFLVPGQKSSSSVMAQSVIYVLDQNGKPSEHSFTFGPCMIDVSGTYGEKMFVTRGQLKRSNCLVNDSLKIRCNLTVLKASYLQTTKSGHSMVSPATELHMHFGNLLDSGENTDVTFDVDGELFHAHKLVLAARSPVFKAELYGSMKEARSRSIVIKDMKAPIFKEMLNFIYRDSLSKAHLSEDNNTEQDSFVFAEHLMVAADRYGLDRLKTICVNKLYDSINIDNVARILVLAEQHDCSHLKTTCLELLGRSEVVQAVLTTDEFQYLCKTCPTVLKEIPIQKKRKI